AAGEARALFDALVEDRAAAHLFDAPRAPLAAALATVARAARLRALDISELEAAPPAYPAEVPARDGSLVAWLSGAQPIAAAAVAARRDRGVAPRGVDAALWTDLLDALADLLDAAGAEGMSVVARQT